MPKPGFASITIKETIYDAWFKWYADRLYNLRTQFGITSFAGLMTLILSNQKPENYKTIVEPLLKVQTDKKDRAKII